MNDPRPGEWNEPDEVRDERLSELYRATRAAEPPAWLDRCILAAARTAMKPPPAPAIPLPRRRGSRFWAVPVALAATVVLAVGLSRWLPPVGELGGIPAPMEEKAARSLAQPAAELDAVRAKSADTAVAPPAAPLQSVPASPAASRSSAPASRSAESPRAEPPPQGAGKANVHGPAIRRPPAAWRAEIAELRRQGRHAEAEARLAEFRRHYPHEPLNEAEPPR
jgi:hypothetical protein